VSRVGGDGRSAKKTCCMISELLEETGIDRDQLRRAKRQVLEGVMLLCQWQLERMNESRAATAAEARKGRKVKVE
jgi:hypothetical protein